MLSFGDFVERSRPGQGYRPYPWQERLAALLADETRGEADHPGSLWITAPTGAGKTTAIDAAIWALAAQADRPPTERTIGVRIIWAIDRRLLVDEVYEHASAIAERLRLALEDVDDPLRDIAARLLALAADGRWTPSFDVPAATEAGFLPLEAARWRGGAIDATERRSPFQPMVVTSTVQQVGSRLLFRGYGVSNRSRPLEAALVAHDATAFLDEAHLAAPFADTVAAVIDHQRQHPRERLSLPPALRLVTLTATPPTDASGAVVGLSQPDLATPKLAKRLSARKTVRTVQPEPKPAEQLAALAVEALSDPDGGVPPIVAVVVNRVRTATDVHDRLTKVFARTDDAPARALLIGPQRASDRRGQLEPIRDWVFGKRDPERPVVLVATQTFEVGLDADVSHLITQSASVSALVQRFGRVNRRGVRVNAAITVVRDEGFSLYADDEPAAWSWLQELENEGGDVSVGALLERPRPAQSRPPRAPTLTDLIVQQLAQTTHDLDPHQEPDVDGLLRGAEEDQVREVTVVWRADLTPPGADPFGTEARRYRHDLLRLAPPQPDEAVTLSIVSVKELIAGERGALRRALDGADFPVAVPEPPGAPLHPRLPFVVLRGRDVLAGVWSQPREDAEITIAQLRLGDTVVLPLAAGGIDASGVRPTIETATESRLEFDPFAGPSLPFVRVTPALVVGDTDSAEWDGGRADAWSAIVERLDRELDPGGDGKSDVERKSPLDARSGARWLELLRAVRSSPRAKSHPALVDLTALEATLGNDDWVARPLDRLSESDAVALPTRLRAGWVLRRAAPRADREERLGATDIPVTLDAHSDAVAARAGGWADALGTTPDVAQAVRLAALGHDLGKADPRIQAWFAGGTRKLGTPPLAKSVFGTHDPTRSRAARERAGAPRRLRHELASVAALADAIDRGATPGFAGADRELALHLVGTHHGWGRPSFPTPEGGAPPLRFMARAAGIAGHAEGDGVDGWQDGAWEQRLWALHDRLGPWALAYLEALVVLADRTVSKEGR